MEPRPQRPSRATGPFISTGTPNPPTAGASGPAGVSGYGQPAFDASSAPPAPPPAIGYDPDYSPGQPLTPLRGPRAANVVGPLLAVAALAIIVAAVAFIVSQFRGGDGDEDSTQPTAVVAVSGSPTTDAGDDDGADAGERDATQPVAGEDAETTGPDDAEPTRTPRVNRPTDEPGDLTGEDEADPGAEEEPSERTRARQWLPTGADVGDGFETADEGTRSEQQVVESFGEGSDAAARLAEFGWQENAYRNFELATGGESDTTSMTVSVHRFDSESGAQEAMPFFAEGSGLAPVDDAPDLGEESITVGGAIEGGNAYVIYIRQDSYVLRIGGFSVAGDPGELTTAVAETMLAG